MLCRRVSRPHDSSVGRRIFYRHLKGNLNMDTRIFKSLADKLHDILWCEQGELCLNILRGLAKGGPVSISYLASTLNISHESVKQALLSLPYIEYDQAGNILASGLSLTPTPYRFQVGDKDLYTWCALDTLMYPVLLGQPANVESQCPITGALIKLTVSPTEVKHVSPVGTVLSLVVPENSKTSGDVHDTFCNHVYFISSHTAAERWSVAQSDSMILSLKEAFHLGQDLARRRLGYI